LLFNNYKDYLRNDWIGSWIPTVHPTFSKRSLEEGVPNQSLGTAPTNRRVM